MISTSRLRHQLSSDDESRKDRQEIDDAALPNLKYTEPLAAVLENGLNSRLSLYSVI